MALRLIRIARTCLPVLTTGLIIVACNLEEAGPAGPLNGPDLRAANVGGGTGGGTGGWGGGGTGGGGSGGTGGGADAGPDAPPPPPPSAACYAAAWAAFCAGADCCDGNAFACNGARNDASSAHSYCCFEASYTCEETSDYDDCMEGMGCGGGIIPPGLDPCGNIAEQPGESWGEACQAEAQQDVQDFIDFLTD